MKRVRVFTDEEMKKLLLNPNIVGIKNKSQIIYKNEFKLWAVLQKIKYPEKTARQIFSSAGFDMDILNSRTPQKRLLDWKERYYKFGKEYFISNNNYNYKTNKGKLDDEEITDLINALEKNNLLIKTLILKIENIIK